MRTRELQQAIDRAVTIRARVLGLEFQAEPCQGRHFVVDYPSAGQRALQRLKLYRSCDPTREAVTDTALEMLGRLNERFGPGRVWTIGNDGSSKRIGIMTDEMDDRRFRAYEDGKIRLRMYYVHEHSQIGPNDADPESAFPSSDAGVRVEIDPAQDADFGMSTLADILKQKYTQIEPLDVAHGGVKLRDLLKIDEERRREGHPNYRAAWLRLSDAQRGAVSAHWSAELRAKVAESKERERRRVTVDMETDE
jgi:hypothetical protein